VGRLRPADETKAETPLVPNAAAAGRSPQRHRGCDWVIVAGAGTLRQGCIHLQARDSPREFVGGLIRSTHDKSYTCCLTRFCFLSSGS